MQVMSKVIKVKNKKTRQIAMVAREAAIGQFAEENLIHRGCYDS
jgi:hypothetical protein